MKQTFTILLVEDKPRAMKGQMKEIGNYLDKKDFKLDLITDETGETVEETIRTGDVDIVVTDKNLTDEMSGIDVIKVIRNNGFPIDVLFYSAIDFDVDEISSKLDHYGFVEIVEGKTIVNHLTKLIDKNIKRCEDIVFLRGLVISGVIDLELKINEFLGGYFKIPKKTINEFYDFILENRYNSLGGKVVTLDSIVKKHSPERQFNKFLQEIREVNNTRNELAHCKADPGNKNCLISMGTPKRYDRKDIYEILKKIKRVSENLDKLAEKVC